MSDKKQQHDGFCSVEENYALVRTVSLSPDGWLGDAVFVWQLVDTKSNLLKPPLIRWSGQDDVTDHEDVKNFIKALLHASEIAELWTQDVGNKLVARGQRHD